MEEKLQRVVLWLKKIYGNQPIPEYEVNPRTVDILYELAEHNEASERDVSLLIEDMKQKATEYEAEANYLQELLMEGLGLSISSLSSEGISCLNALVNSAVILETKDTSLTSFFGAINHMTSELYATKLKNKKLEVELNNITKKITAALMLEKRLEEDLKKSEEIIEIDTDKADSQVCNLQFLEDKSKDMNLRIKAAEKQLADTGLDQSLTHESLVNLSEELAEVQNEIVTLKKKLGFYLDLAPNPTLARVKIEEVKRELDALEIEISKEVDMLTLELPKPSKYRFN